MSDTASSSALVSIAVDLTRSLTAADRYQRLLEAVRRVIPCDATALLALQGDTLVPLAVHGLAPQVLGMRFARARHPRLDAVIRSDQPVRFPADSTLPDPFDGLLVGDRHALGDVHDCLGCPLVAEGRVIGALTADALEPAAFDGLTTDLLVALGALAGAALQTTRLIELVEARAEQRGLLVAELTRDALGTSDQMLGVSPAMERLRREIDLVAPSDLAVLLLGETGAGKELAARALHAGSPRRSAPFIQVNCAALPESVVESELFGHMRGAFTGATTTRPGKLEIADGGTLFLDEVGELPLSVQPVLLRAVQDGEVQRVGADESHRVDVRIIAATNRDLAAEVARGRFRADLFHRLDVVPIRVPPLRERRSDIAILAGAFADRYRAQLGLGQVVIDREAMAALEAGDWPGNVRELDHVLARGVLRASARAPRGGRVLVEARDLDVAAPDAAARRPAVATQDELVDRVARGAVPLRDAVDAFKRSAVERALADSGGSFVEAARVLGMDRGNLHHLARRLGVHTRSR